MFCVFQDKAILGAISECLVYVPDDLFDKLIADDFLCDDRFILGTFVRCYLVAKGRQPIAILNNCIDSLWSNSDWYEFDWYWGPSI